MESSDPNDNNAIEAYAARLEDRITVLEKTIANFSIAGQDISGNIDTGFNYSPNNQQEGQYVEQ